jgi:hypothetical protein
VKVHAARFFGCGAAGLAVAILIAWVTDLRDPMATEALGMMGALAGLMIGAVWDLGNE